MGSATGPISTLPGAKFKVPAGTLCDHCEDDDKKTPAVVRIQGETDSFGAELLDLCAECAKKVEDAPDPEWPCDWCKKENGPVKPVRDPEESMCGPVYHICADCNKKRLKTLADMHDYLDSVETEYDDDPRYCEND